MLLSAALASQPICGKDQIKAACDELKEGNKEFLTLSNGMKWKNPLYVPPASNAQFDPTFIDKQIEFQVELQNILSKISQKVPLSDRFRMAFNQVLPMLTSLDVEVGVGMPTGMGGNDMGFGMTLPRLPLPMGDENGKFQNITHEQLKEILSKLPEESIDELRELAKRHGPQFNGGGFGYGNTANGPNELTPIQRVVAHNKTRMTSLFEQTKSILLAKIKKGRALEALTPEEKSVVSRIEKITLNHGDSEDVINSEQCSNYHLNAFYRKRSHSINICPAYYAAPDTQIIKVLGHEIGHSLDPCISSMKLRSFSSNHPAMMPQKNHIADPIARQLHPFNGVERCLVSNVGIREPNIEDAKISAQLLARYEQLENNLSDEMRAIVEKTTYENSLQDMRCDGTFIFNTEVNEAMSDVYGNIALNEYLKSHPLKNRADRLAVLIKDQNICDMDEPQDDEPIRYNSLTEKLIGRAAKLKNQHPHRLLRVERLTLQLPEVASKLSCRRNSKYICYDEYLVGTENSNRSRENKGRTSSEGRQ